MADARFATPGGIDATNTSPEPKFDRGPETIVTNDGRNQSTQLLQRGQGDRRRKRNHLWVEAAKLAAAISFIFGEAWGQRQSIEGLAKCYTQEVHDKTIVLGNQQTRELKLIPYRTRFSPDYYPEKSRKIRREISFDTAIFLTLTIDPKLFYCLKDAYQGIRKAWHKLGSAMANDVKRGMTHVQSWDGRYLLAVEFQKIGSPHLHVVLAGARWVDADWVRSIWSVGTFVKMDYVHDNRSKVVHYVTKYMMKGAGDFTHVSLLWALNARAFSTSARIFNVLKNNCNKNQAWTYLGVFPQAVAALWTTIEDVERYQAGYGERG